MNGGSTFTLPNGEKVEIEQVHWCDVREVIEPGDAFHCDHLRPKGLQDLLIEGFALPPDAPKPPKQASLVLEVYGKIAVDMSVRAALVAPLAVPIHVPTLALIKVVQLDVPELVVLMLGKRSGH